MPCTQTTSEESDLTGIEVVSRHSNETITALDAGFDIQYTVVYTGITIITCALFVVLIVIDLFYRQ